MDIFKPIDSENNAEKKEQKSMNPEEKAMYLKNWNDTIELGIPTPDEFIEELEIKNPQLLSKIKMQFKSKPNNNQITFKEYLKEGIKPLYKNTEIVDYTNKNIKSFENSNKESKSGLSWSSETSIDEYTNENIKSFENTNKESRSGLRWSPETSISDNYAITDEGEIVKYSDNLIKDSNSKFIGYGISYKNNK